MKKYLFVLIGWFLFIGCSGKYSEVENSGVNLKNKDKAYVEFLRKDQFFGGGADLFVYEIIDDKLVPIIALANNQKYIYEVSKGKHKFYSTLYNIIEVDVKDNTTYHIDILPNNKYMWYALLIEDNQDINNAINELTQNGCQENILNKYNFTKRENDYKSPISLIVTCKDNKLVKYENLKDTPSTEQINKIPIVKLSKFGKEYFENPPSENLIKFNEYKPFWENKLKNIPLINEAYMKFEKLPSDKTIKKYDGINVISKTNSEEEKELVLNIANEFKSYDGANKLTIEIIVNKLFDGSFLKRDASYMMNTVNHYESIGLIDLTVNYYDNKDKIAAYNIITSVDASGLVFQKINTNESQIIKEISNYTKSNFMKNKQDN